MLNPNLKATPFIVGTMRLGTWGAQFSSQAYEKFIDQCVDLGLTHFDHADIYGHYTTEAAFGAVLKRRADLRKKVQLTTKCGIRLVTPNRPAHQLKSYDLSKAHIIASVEHSLQALGKSVLDCFLLHRPDFLMDPHEIAEAFTQLKAAGKVLDVGVSNFSTSQFELLHSFTPLSIHQVEISALHLAAFQDGTLDQCLQHQVIPTAWSPFGGGAIFGETANPVQARLKAAAEVLAQQYDTGVDQILLAFLRSHPAGIIPILGTSKIERIKAAYAQQNLQLTKAEWYALWQATTGEEVA